MRYLLSLMAIASIGLHGYAQNKVPKTQLPTGMSMEDLQKMATMSPQELEAYKTKMLKQAEANARQLAKAGNIKLDETVLPTTSFYFPVKDMKRLATLPAAPPTLNTLMGQLTKQEAALKQALPTSAVQKVESIAAGKSALDLRNAAIGGWYRDNPEAAMLLSMKAVQKSPEDILGWNNLAALMNMTGLEHQAVPILLYGLNKYPNSSILLNNMGQSYLGMGDVNKATQYFKKCLTIDDLHPEANHSMALISLQAKDMEAAMRHFEKELTIAQRRSSLALLAKHENREKLNLTALRNRKMQLDGTNRKDFFEEIALGKFKLPDLPKNSEQAQGFMKANKGFMESLQNEFLFWSNAGIATPQQLSAEGKRYPGIYADLVDELIRELGDQYAPILALFGEDDVSHLDAMTRQYYKTLSERECPPPPSVAGGGAAVMEAHQRKCCDIKKPIIDQYVADYNAFVTNRIQIVLPRWKVFLNTLINYAQLDPSIGNQRLVCSFVSQYFTFLIQCMQAAKLDAPPMECHTTMTTEEADAILAANHDFKLDCPDWLEFEVSLKLAKLKVNCESYNIEADVYGIINVGAEKQFKSGTSTLYVGAGIDGSFKEVAEGEITQQFYIVFDHNNQFSDVGMRGTANGELAGGMIGAEFGYDFSMSSGFNAQGKTNSAWVENYTKALGYVTK
ncbi:hypothetical protein KJS94_08845 [Flavihumibacter rivuli]|uniref:tetratricopeptide repeat protein n=1 Tax=Flavihumibacter rivuli TaxID=2838156 RepID=UPI001BDEBB80|nr:tetratricopeptide repeat protein [Flavihumibacter rivuli]ULQ58300.1 hypothetical protein KJS94_08845 [Flavihumibacter rivuli]